MGVAEGGMGRLQPVLSHMSTSIRLKLDRTAHCIAREAMSVLALTHAQG